MPEISGIFYDFIKTDSVIDIYCVDYGLSLIALDIHQNRTGLEAEICIESPNGDFKKSGIKLNLQKHDERQRLARSLKQNGKSNVPWEKLIDTFCEQTIELYRNSGLLMDASGEPESMFFPSFIQGLQIPVGLPSTIFAPGGKGKSLFAAYLSTLIRYGIVPDRLPFAPRQANVLYLDWEAGINPIRVYMKAIRKGLDIETPERIDYLECPLPIFDMADSIKKYISEREIGFIIIDSQMAATAGGSQYQTEAERASAYYNILNSFKCTSLTIDHVTKESMKTDNGGAGTAYGTVVKYNRARSQYELRSQQDTESNHLEFALIHQKYNLGRKQKPLGIAVDFESINEELQSITFSQCDLAENPELNKALPQYTRIKMAIIQNGGKATPAEIAEITGISGDSVSMALGHYRQMFIQLNKKEHTWGVLANDEQQK